jgi:hypothetical protein
MIPEKKKKTKKSIVKPVSTSIPKQLKNFMDVEFFNMWRTLSNSNQITSFLRFLIQMNNFCINFEQNSPKNIDKSSLLFESVAEKLSLLSLSDYSSCLITLTVINFKRFVERQDFYKKELIELFKLSEFYTRWDEKIKFMDLIIMELDRFAPTQGGYEQIIEWEETFKKHVHHSVEVIYLRQICLNTISPRKRKNEEIFNVDVTKIDYTYEVRANKEYKEYCDYADLLYKRIFKPFIVHIAKSNCGAIRPLIHSTSFTDFVKNSFTNRRIPERKRFLLDIENARDSLLEAKDKSSDKKLLAIIKFREEIENLLRVENEQNFCSFFKPKSKMSECIQNALNFMPSRR